MKLRILFHTGKGPDFKNGKWRWLKAKLISGGIKTWTFALALVRLDFKSLKYNYSHCEGWWPDEDGKFKIPFLYSEEWDYEYTYGFIGFCFSSTTRGKYKGVRIAPAHEVLKNPHRWVYIETEVADEDWARFLPWIEQMDKDKIKYDFLGLFGFFLPINIQDKKKWYCSEIVSYICWRLNLTKKRHKRISPRRLAKVLAKLYHEPKNL